jgi:hypothetical protein
MHNFRVFTIFGMKGVLKIVCDEKGERKNGCDGSDYES